MGTEVWPSSSRGGRKETLFSKVCPSEPFNCESASHACELEQEGTGKGLPLGRRTERDAAKNVLEESASTGGQGGRRDWTAYPHEAVHFAPCRQSSPSLQGFSEEALQEHTCPHSFPGLESLRREPWLLEFLARDFHRQPHF